MSAGRRPYGAPLPYGSVPTVYTLSAEAGSFALAGQTASLLHNRRLDAGAGSFELAGQDAALVIHHRLAAAPGAFTISGEAGSVRLDTWESLRRKSGKEPFNWIEFEIDRCTLTYGTAPCAAGLGVTGSEKCCNGWETCQDQDNFHPAPFWVRLCEPIANIPTFFPFDEADDGTPNFIPLLNRDGVKHSPSLPNPGESLGQRAQLTVTFSDAPHHDIGIDKYALERLTGDASQFGLQFDPMTRSTFMRKMRKRFPHYVGRRFRWYQGYRGHPLDPRQFRKREFIMEKWQGPDANGRVSIVSKDLLKLLDDERSQAPFKSTGQLVGDLAKEDSITELDVLTSDTAEYDLEAGQTEDYVRIGGEGFTYTGVTVVDDTHVTLTGVTRELPDGYITPADDHKDGDLVQRCAYLTGTIPEVVKTLMVKYAGIDESFIPFSDWETEAETWLADEQIARLIGEPEGVRALVDEITSQTLTWAFWVDELDQKIRFRAMRPVDLGDTVTQLTDAGHIIEKSFSVVDEPDRVVNEVQVLYGQINPFSGIDEIDNYRSGFVKIDGDSQGPRELNQRRIKRIFARWRRASDGNVVLRHTDRVLKSRAANLMSVQFKIERKDERVRTGEFADLATLYLIDALGMPITTRVQVLRVSADDEEVSFKAREDFFKSLTFGRWAPDELDGLAWEDATDEQKARYIFWADEATGFLGTTSTVPTTDPGKTWA